MISGLALLAALAGAAEISGTVRREGDGAGIPDAVVAIAGQSARTDVDGHFTLADVAPGAWTVTIAGPGLRHRAPPDITVTEAPMVLELWVVEDLVPAELVATYRTPSTEGPARTLTREEIRNLPGSMGDPVRALQTLPGMGRTPFESGWVLVRGGGFQDTGLFLDGVPVPVLFHLGGAVSILHPELVESVHFYPNAAPARLGRHLSGAVNLESRAIEPTDPPRAAAGANLVFSQAYAEAPTKNGGVAIGLRRSYLDGVLAAVLDAERAKIAPRFWDAQARWDTGRTSLLVIALSDTIESPATDEGTFTATQRAVQLQGHTEVPAGSGTFETRAWLTAQGSFFDARPTEQRLSEQAPGLRLEYVGSDHSAYQLRVGAELQSARYDLTQGFTTLLLPPGTTDLEAAEEDLSEEARLARGSHADPYIEVSTGRALKSFAGLRYETLFATDQLPRGGLSPRFGMTWRATDRLTLDAEAARTHQPPNSFLLYGYPDGAYLPLQRSDGMSAGPRWDDGRVAIEVDGWMRRMHDIAGFERDGTIGQQEGLAYGFETWTRTTFGVVETRLLYQYGRSFLREAPDIHMASSPYPYDQPHRLEWINTATLPHSWRLAGRFRYTSGYPLDPEVFRAYDILRQRAIAVVPRNGRLAPFHAIDVKVIRRWTTRQWRIDGSLDIQNAYNRRVPEPVINGGVLRPGYGYGLPVLPIFGIDAAYYPRQSRERATSSR